MKSYPCKVIAFDMDEDSLINLREALPDSLIELIEGATAASLSQDWNPGIVDLVVVKVARNVAKTTELCKFLVSRGVLARDASLVTDSPKALPTLLGLRRHQPTVARQPHSPLLALVPPGQRNDVTALLKAGVDSCLLLPINANDVANMLLHAQARTVAKESQE